MTKKQLKEALISKFLEVASENNYKKQIKKIDKSKVFIPEYPITRIIKSAKPKPPRPHNIMANRYDP